MTNKLAFISSLSILGLMSLSLQTFAATTDTKEATATFDLVAPDQTLTINNATDLPFAQATISADDVVTTNSSEVSVTIQELSGMAPGWQLSAKLGDFTGKTNNRTLTGAQLFYPSITPTTTNTGNTSTILPVSVATDSSFEGSTKGKIISAGGDAANIVTAASGKGYGAWTMSYGTGKMQLKIPAGNLKDNYTATLTYTLTDSPG